MGGYEAVWCDFGWWWIFPIVMIILCFFMMRGRMCGMMGGRDTKDVTDTDRSASPDSAREILDRRYALGEIGQEEYEEKKKDISN
jgi:uncharacterized membrane protein